MHRRSYSPSPPRGYGRRGRSPPSPRGRYGGYFSRDGPTSLLVLNLRHDCRNRVYDRRGSPPRSISPLGKRYVRKRPLSRDYRERSFSPSPARYSRSLSRSPVRDQSPPYMKQKVQRGYSVKGWCAGDIPVKSGGGASERAQPV
ncbi:hypothetical protein Leryth_003899 [Lithospermum erythrorhizon]|nr:hypothetical protein Leryth_003899 [Lithospermum erythrorhizon]